MVSGVQWPTVRRVGIWAIVTVLLLSIAALLGRHAFSALSGNDRSEYSTQRSNQESQSSTIPFRAEEAGATQRQGDLTDMGERAAAQVGFKRASTAILRKVGSEGYGPYIRKAFSEGSAADAYEAHLMLAACERIDSDIAQAHRMAETLPAARKHPGVFKPVIESMELEQRYCQTVTGDLKGLSQPLLLKAIQEGVQGVAPRYLQAKALQALAQGSQVPVLSVEERGILLAALMRDMTLGDFESLKSLLLDGRALGLSAEQLGQLNVLLQSVGGTDKKAAENLQHLLAIRKLSEQPLDASNQMEVQKRIDDWFAAMRAAGMPQEMIDELRRSSGH